MRCSYEYKKQCAELYWQGTWAKAPVGVKEKNFQNMIRIQARTEKFCGAEALRYKKKNKM